MIVFATCVGSPETYRSCAAPGLDRVVEGDSLVAEVTTDRSIHEAYNEILEHCSTLPDLEALVLMHEDVELFDADFGTRVRYALSDPDVAIVGAVGARRVRSLAWWWDEIAGRAVEPRGVVGGSFDNPEVDGVDGLLMVLSPWAVRNLRCDTERYDGFHGYDLDLCFQARAADRKVIVADFTLFHHTKGGLGDHRGWEAANDAFVAKWASFAVERATA